MVVVFGGTGFLGRHIRRALARANTSDCTIVTRTRPADELAAHEAWVPSAAFRDGAEVAERLIARSQTVIYAAGAANPANDGSDAWLDDLGAAARAFAMIGAHNSAARVVLISSGGCVYECPMPPAPIKESGAIAPRSYYGFSKLATEEALRLTARNTGLCFSILRLANPVGEFQTSAVQGFVAAVLRALSASKPITLFGDDQYVRDYFDADDCAEAVLLAARATSPRNEIWNVGSGVGRSRREVIELVQSVTGRTVETVIGPARPADVRYNVLNCEKIRRDLGWSARRDLRDTIWRMWKAATTNDGARSRKEIFHCK